MSTIVLAISGMHCASCGMLIDEAVEDLPGVRHSRTDMRAERTTVEFDDDSGVGAAELVATIEAEGYGARVLSAGPA